MQRTSRPVATVLIVACTSIGLLAPSAIADQPATSPKSPNAATPATPATPPTQTTPATPATPAKPGDKAKSTNAERRKGYGVLCKGQSKKHVKGQKGTPFSRCVVAAAKQREKTEVEAATPAAPAQG